MSAHMTPEQVRSKIDHPIVDGDGHWVEYDPVFSDKMRKVGGDLAADGFLKAMGTTREAAARCRSPSAARSASGQQAFWSRQAENTLDRATAMMPKLLYDRLDELGLDFVVVYPTAGLRLPRIQDDATRRAVIRAYNIVSADYFSGLGDRMTPAAIIPMHTPDEAIAELEFVTKQLGSKVGMFGSNMAAQGAGGRGQRPRHRALCGVVRRARHRQRIRLRPGLGEMRRARHRADLPQRQQQPGSAAVADQFHLQPYRPFRRGRACDRQGDLPRRRHPALPGTALCLPRRRRRLGQRSCSAI